MNARIEAELKLLRLHFSEVQYKEANSLHWFRVASLHAPPLWSPALIPVVFSVTQGHPGTLPYGFFVPTAVTYNSNPPDGTGAPNQPPFEGSWRFLSWQPEGWRPTGDLATGDNLWGWVRSFVGRLREGK